MCMRVVVVSTFWNKTLKTSRAPFTVNEVHKFVVNVPLMNTVDDRQCSYELQHSVRLREI